MLMEITLKEEDYLAESEIISDFDKASQEGLMEFLRSGGSLQKELMGFGKISDDIIIENINNLTKEDIKEVANMLVLDTIYILKGRA